MKLFANGLTVLHVGAATYEADEVGMFDVDPAHAEMALAHGASATDPRTASVSPLDNGDLTARVAALEAAVAGLQEPAPKRK